MNCKISKLKLNGSSFIILPAEKKVLKMLQVRYLLYMGLFIYLLDLNQMIGSDALSILPKKEKSDDEESENNAEESSDEPEKEAFYKMAYHDKSRETHSGEHLQYAFNPYCSWLKFFGPAGLQSNCLLNSIIGVYKIYKKYSLAIKAFI